jgi:hypothetical protein
MQTQTKDATHNEASRRYNACYNNTTYLAATAGKDTDRANLLIDAALWICGSPYHTWQNIAWDETERAFLDLFYPPGMTHRSLRQEEIDAIYRNDFIQQVLDAISSGRTARFLIHKTKYAIFTAKMDGTNRFDFSAGDNHRFSFRLSEFVEQLEEIYDSGLEIISLVGEVQIAVKRATANADAEPDHLREVRRREEARRLLGQ